MSADASAILALASAGLAGTGMTAVAALRGWQSWLDVRRDAIAARRGASPNQTIAALRQRVRRLEAIANGVE